MIIFSKLFLSRILIIAGCLPLFALVSAGQQTQNNDGDVFPIPDAYRVEGIPAIKKSEVENLFYDPASIRSNLIWDADSKNRRLLVTDEKNSVYLLDAPLEKPVRLTQGFVPSKVRMRPDGASFAYNSDQEDEDNYQLYLFDLKEKTPKKLTTLTGKDESIESFTWSKAGDSLFYIKIDTTRKPARFVKTICRRKPAFRRI